MPQSIKTDKKPPFDPYLWRENRRKKMVAHETLRLSVLSQVRDALIFLSHRYHWGSVYVFGSVIKKGKFHPNSDVDLAVKGLDKFQLYSFISDISSFLQRDVDVVLMEECHFSESIIQRGVKWNPEKKSLYF
jgi:predicted nucleotidyltransferase